MNTQPEFSGRCSWVLYVVLGLSLTALFLTFVLIVWASVAILL